MTERRDDDAVLAQRGAADPGRSVWVAANAGSGKTRVLTERVARLLLEGAPPEKILCLTFTKAAAAEMQNRLFATLGGWTMADDDKLAASLAGLTGGADVIPAASARRLFAKALETPGGLKIQTIHAFCDGLLRRFPLEAGAPPGFRVMESRERAALIAETLAALAMGAAHERAALAGVAADLNEGGVEDLAAKIAERRDLFPEVVDEAGLCAAFGVSHPPEEARERIAALQAMDRDTLLRMNRAWALGSEAKNYREKQRAHIFAEALTRGDGDLAIELGALGNLLTGEGKRRGPPTKAVKRAEMDWEALTAHLEDVAEAVREAELAAGAAERALRLAHFGGAFVARYEAAKSSGSLLDFDDLVGRAGALLTESAMAQWALYRLDGGVDHILVDEAQDTSSAQWTVINAVAREFRAGDGAREVGRTSFVVGDEKQSIYSFQGAAPGKFDEMRGIFAAELQPFGGLREEALRYSFRSAPAILRAVDSVFSGPRAEGLTATGADADHAAFHAKRAGRVELWPLVEPDEKPAPPDPWAPVDMPTPRKPRLKLAEAVADYVKTLVSNAQLPGGGRLVTPGDIIILLRARHPMMAPIIRGLKRRGVPVAGADRLKLTEELAVRDLLAFMRFAVTPDDDLTLAALLRSPLFDVEEEALFDLAHDRPGTLWAAVKAQAARFAREVAALKEAERAAGFLRPFEILQSALLLRDDQGLDGRRRLIARLGRAAEDPIEELLAQALAYEEDGPPSLEGFLAWLARGEVEIKREQEGARGEVRVMSVHGAKGQEAPIVILPDTMSKPVGKPGPVAPIETNGGPLAAWRRGRGLSPALLRAQSEDERRRDEHEHRRLLYVAMTRAEDWLIVAGAGEEKTAEGTWWALVRDGLADMGNLTREEPSPTGMGAMTVYDEAGEPKTEDDEEAGRAAAAGEAAALAGWITTPPDASTDGPPVLARRPASGLAPFEEVAAGPGLPPELARLRGEAIHAALEAGGTDPGALRRIIAGFPLPEDLIDGAAVEAARARGLPEAARFFAADAIAEAGVSVLIGEARVVGRIDRLLVTEDEVAFVDFKSDAAPPEPGAPAQDAYLAQMAAYRAALGGVYPGRRITAHILWTAAPRLDRIADDALNRALSGALHETLSEEQAERLAP